MVVMKIFPKLGSWIPPRKINMEHNVMEVWFRWFSFANGVIFRFQAWKVSGKWSNWSFPIMINQHHEITILGSTPQKSNIDTQNCHVCQGSYLFQTIILGIQPLVFGSVCVWGGNFFQRKPGCNTPWYVLRNVEKKVIDSRLPEAAEAVRLHQSAQVKGLWWLFDGLVLGNIIDIIGGHLKWFNLTNIFQVGWNHQLVIISSQIITTSPKNHLKWWWKVREMGPRNFQGNLGWWNIIPFGQIFDWGCSGQIIKRPFPAGWSPEMVV